MQTFLFIVILFAVALTRAILTVLSESAKRERNILAMVLIAIIAIGMGFVYPLAFIWTIDFLLGFELGYWQAFMLMIVFGVFFSYIEKGKEENGF
jgi:fatty acid desaturase